MEEPPDYHFSWATNLRPHRLLRLCTPFTDTGAFRHSVEVVMYPEASPVGLRVLPSREYLQRGPELDETATTVRFNAETTEPFSIIWEETTVRGDPEAVGRIHAIGPPSMTTDFMREMVEKSATSRQRLRLEAVLKNGMPLSSTTLGNGNGPDLPPARSSTETGLVRSVAAPPTRLRLLSRLDGEVLRPGELLTHDLLLAATVPDAVSEAGGMVCQISVYPRGWLTIQVPGAPPREDIELAVVPDWARPPEGRTGTGAHYVFETRLAKATLQLVDELPAARQPASGRRQAEVLARLISGNREVCRLHHPFGIEAPTRRGRGSSDTAERLQRLVDLTLLNDAAVAKLTGARTGDVQAWARDERAPTARQGARLHELTDLVDRLTTVIDPDYVAQWLRRPVPALDEARPVDLLAAGDLERVSRVVAALESPVAS